VGQGDARCLRVHKKPKGEKSFQSFKPQVVMFWLWLGLKAESLAWLILALALKNLEPGQGAWLGLGLAWPGPQALAFALYI